MSAAGGCGGFPSILQKLGLKPVTKCSLVKFYVPAFGVASYSALSLNVMNPGLAVRIFPKRDITNFLLGSAIIGTGSYVYSRDHMSKASPGVRVLYGAAGGALLTLGSILLWAVLRSFLPANPTLCTVVGIGSGLALVQVGSSYLTFVDSQIPKK